MIAVRILLAGALACGAVSGCVAPVGPVEVTRFHLPDTARLGRGTISVMPAAGIDAASLEYRSYAEAVSRELIRLGYSESMAGSVEQTATITLERRAVEAQRRSPVSVGVGGGTGSWGGGVGVGLGIDLSGPPPARIETELGVTIRENVSGASLWEGRARFAVSAKSPLAQTQLAAPRMAQALFSGFPGTSGETISVE